MDDLLTLTNPGHASRRGQLGQSFHRHTHLESEYYGRPTNLQLSNSSLPSLVCRLELITLGNFCLVIVFDLAH